MAAPTTYTWDLGGCSVDQTTNVDRTTQLWSRRTLLRRAGLTAASLSILAACGPASTPAAPTSAPTTAPTAAAKPTAAPAAAPTTAPAAAAKPTTAAAAAAPTS